MNFLSPSNFGSSSFMIAAFDTFDHDEATLSGIGGSHDTVSVAFQDDDNYSIGKPKVSATRKEYGSKTFKCELKCQELQPFHKPTKRSDLSDLAQNSWNALNRLGFFQRCTDKVYSCSLGLIGLV